MAAVLCGNRNFEGRINPLVRANYLASPPLVVAYALAGPHGHRSDAPSRWARTRRQAGFSARYLADARRKSRRRCGVGRAEMFAKQYSEVFEGDAHWKSMQGPDRRSVPWDANRHTSSGRLISRHGRRRHRRWRIFTSARAGGAGRQRNHRSYFAGGHDSRGQSRGKISDGEWRRSRTSSTPTARGAGTTK